MSLNEKVFVMTAWLVVILCLISVAARRLHYMKKRRARTDTKINGYQPRAGATPTPPTPQVVVDFSRIDSMTLKKVRFLTEPGKNAYVSGLIVTVEGSPVAYDRALVERSAVRYLSDEQFQALMHPNNPFQD